MTDSQNGETDDRMRESFALLRMLEYSSADVEAGRLRDSEEVFADIRRMIEEKRSRRFPQGAASRKLPE